MVRLMRASGRLSGTAPGRLAPSAKRVEPFYHSPEWIALRERRKRDADYGVALSRAKPGERVILDHKRERKDGGESLDPANTEWLTHSEHQAKTARAKRARAFRRARPGGGSISEG
jgi:hypothetical protein